MAIFLIEISVTPPRTDELRRRRRDGLLGGRAYAARQLSQARSDQIEDRESQTIFVSRFSDLVIPYFLLKALLEAL